MRRRYILMPGVAAVIALSLAFLLFASSESFAQKEGCFIEGTLSAPGAGDQEFEFVVQTEGGNSFFLQDGETNSGTLAEGLVRTVTEAPQNGYVFAGIECESLGGLIVTNFQGGFTLECANAELGDATCTIINLRDTSAIPTLSEWGMIAAAAGLAMIGVFFAVRRRRAQAV